MDSITKKFKCEKQELRADGGGVYHLFCYEKNHVSIITLPFEAERNAPLGLGMIYQVAITPDDGFHEGDGTTSDVQIKNGGEW